MIKKIIFILLSLMIITLLFISLYNLNTVENKIRRELNNKLSFERLKIQNLTSNDDVLTVELKTDEINFFFDSTIIEFIKIIDYIQNSTLIINERYSKILFKFIYIRTPKHSYSSNDSISFEFFNDKYYLKSLKLNNSRGIMSSYFNYFDLSFLKELEFQGDLDDMNVFYYMPKLTRFKFQQSIATKFKKNDNIKKYNELKKLFEKIDFQIIADVDLK